MDFLALIDPGPDAGLAALFLSSFLSATLLPGGSELVLAGVLKLRPEQLAPALALATLGNTLGGMSTWGLARLLPQRADTTRLDWVRRHGAPVLLLSWAPVVGDALCAAAGWLRLAWLPCLLWMGLGKLLRYALIAFSVT
ncbi:DedA family protein [Azoarcus sp. DN11]|uniref:YqaA family protein n=1 Tax=Azoarcus sp. DN11 TaxID=356837 RepID=UPI000EAB7CCD|nr:DedA family protein [Azoarcus sp. DN11]AYH45816.1 hypothetical protein CDA09_20930 [Azoarcus sp. DN11]